MGVLKTIAAKVGIISIGLTVISTSTVFSQTWRYSDSECADFVAQMAYSIKLADQCAFAIREKSVKVGNECVSRFGKSKSDKASENELRFAASFLKRHTASEL